VRFLEILLFAWILNLQKLLGNRYFLEKQRFLLEILHHVHEPLTNQQWRSLGEHLVTDKEQYVVGIRIQGTKIYD